MDALPNHPTFLPRVTEGLWMACFKALGEDHLLTLALETALRAGDYSLMNRAIGLFANCPESLRKRVLWGEGGA